jgi:hypothetical protein
VQAFTIDKIRTLSECWVEVASVLVVGKKNMRRWKVK